MFWIILTSRKKRWQKKRELEDVKKWDYVLFMFIMLCLSYTMWIPQQVPSKMFNKVFLKISKQADSSVSWWSSWLPISGSVWGCMRHQQQDLEQKAREKHETVSLVCRGLLFFEHQWSRFGSSLNTSSRISHPRIIP